MHQFIGLFQTGKWEDFDQVIATDCVLHYPGGVDIVGLDAMVANWGVVFRPLKDLRAATHAEISEGDILMEFLTFEATYEGEFMGKQVSGVPIKYNQVEMVRISDGKIVEWWVEQDRQWIAQQLGSEDVVEVDELTVTFERDKCIYDGPKVIRQGKVTFALNNLTDATVDIVIGKLESGKTWQDLVDFFSEKNRGVARPEWVSLVSPRPVVGDYRAKIFDLEPGLYAISCGEILQGSWAAWLASPLEVK